MYPSPAPDILQETEVSGETIAISPDGGRFAWVSGDARIISKQLPQGDTLFDKAPRDVTSTEQLEYDSSEKYLVAKCQHDVKGQKRSQLVCVLDAGTGEERWRFEAVDCLFDILVSGDFVLASYTGRQRIALRDGRVGVLKVFDLRTGKNIATTRLSNTILKLMHLDAGRDRLITTGDGWKVWKWSDILKAK